MFMRYLSTFLVGLVLAPGAFAQPEVSTVYLNKKIANLAFTDEAGKTQSLYDLKEKKAIVLVFFSFDCPVSNSYTQPLADMAKEMGKHGVSFIGLTTNDDETPALVAKQARHFNIPFPVYLDSKLAATNALKAAITPECFVLDGDYVLRYRGRIDNAYTERLKKHPQVTRHDLRQVLGELMSGRPVSEPATLAIGCPIQVKANTAAKTGTVTYYRDVAPILQNRCQQCHRPGEVGPFSLMNYKQAANWAEDIKTFTQKGLMPPWKAVEGPAFHNDRRLDKREIDTIAAWVEGGIPQGDPKDAPPPRHFPEGWQLGKPDLILSAESDFILGPTGGDLFRCYVLPTQLKENKFVTAIEVRPSNPRIVHHTLQFIDVTGAGRKLEQAAQGKNEPDSKEHSSEGNYDRGPGYSKAMGVGFRPKGDIGGWAPGQMPRYLPDNSGFFLPKNSDIVMQVHYHRNGRMERDRTQIGLYFAKNKVERPWQAAMMAGGGSGRGLMRLMFSIPPEDPRYPIKGDLWASSDFTLHTIMPHMHMVGKEIKVTMTPPQGQSKTLIAIKEWDYNWQETYIFKEPIKVKAGTQFHVDAFYDNSSKNPNNPFNPPRRIIFGEQTFNEMCFVFLGGISGGDQRKLPVTDQPPKKDTKTVATSFVADQPAVADKPAAVEKPAKKAKTMPVPYKLTGAQHVMVRVKINGKGPYNFIVDTGAPIMFVAANVGKKLGLESDDSGMATLDKLEFEGGLSLSKVKCRVETPFQIEAMNGIGLPGVELHGILGYTVLAKFRMEFDFAKDSMRWTPLDWNPPQPLGISGKGGGQGGLEIIGTVLKYLGPFMGLKSAGPPEPRGFLGIAIAEKDNVVTVGEILAKGPAAEAGLKTGDRITQINGKEVKTGADVQRLIARVQAGEAVQFTIQRGENMLELKITAGEGL